MGYTAECNKEYLYHSVDQKLCEACRERNYILQHGLSRDIEKERCEYLRGKIVAYNECLIFIYPDFYLIHGN